MSRADYLSKYLAPKKKPRAKGRPNIVVMQMPQPDHTPVEEPEHAPDVPIIATKEFKGFKRIDNGEAPQDRKTTSEEKASDAIHQQSKTVYRDSSGRIVDLGAKRKELRESVRDAPVTLTETEIAEQSRKPPKRRFDYDDPMPIFHPEEHVEDESHVYVGISPANRFDIRAGIKWDGIDRSNGFEALVLRSQNEVKFRKMDSKINESYEVDLD